MTVVMMSQQSGDPFAALIRVNTVVQAVVGNSNRDIRGETRAEYQGRQEGQKACRYQSKTRETVQSQTQWSNRVRWERSEMSAGAIQDYGWVVYVCVVGLRSPIDEHRVN